MENESLVTRVNDNGFKRNQQVQMENEIKMRNLDKKNGEN